MAAFEGICLELGLKLKLSKKIEPAQTMVLVVAVAKAPIVSYPAIPSSTHVFTAPTGALRASFVAAPSGWLFDSVKQTISLTDEKRKRITVLCQRMLAKKTLRLKELQVLGGNLNHAAPVIPGASFRVQWNGRACALAEKNQNYKLSAYDRRQLLWWIDQMANLSSRITISDTKMRDVINIYTDSSDYYGGSVSTTGHYSSYLWPAEFMDKNIFIKIQIWCFS
jgi:hypothetical protein